MSEEIRNPSRVLPWAIVGSILLNGALGLAMVFIILVCAGNDIVEVLGSPTGYPFLEIFVRGTGSTGGAAAMGSLISFLVLCALIPSIAAVSREYWSLARDRGVPVWGFWKKVSGSRIGQPSQSPLPPQIPQPRNPLPFRSACFLPILIEES